MTSKLILNPHKVNIAMANECLNPYDLCEKAGIQYGTYKRATQTGMVKPATAGKIAKALNVPVQDLLED